MSGASDLRGATWLPFADKLGHLGLYAVLGATLAWGRFSAGGSLPHTLLVLLGLLYGVSDEWHQSFVPGRHPSAADVAADGLGTLLGYGSTFLFLTRRGTRASSAPPGASSDTVSHV